MKAISLFSGVGGFEIGFERAGIETVLQAESDPVCRSVLERHWPDVERVHDVRTVSREREPAGRGAADRLRAPVDQRRRQAGPGLPDGVDLIYGGFPCQDVSVAGQLAGLSGQRSGLWHEFQRVLRELRPRWCVIENVPGLLSSGAEPGADFGVVLRGLVDLGYGVAWRVLDARWFGVPQRRRRVFLVGCLGDAQRAAQVLAVCESCGGHPQARGQEGEDIAPTLDDGARRASVELPMIAASLSAGSHPSDGHHGHSSPRGDGADNLIAQTLNSSYAKTTASAGSHSGGAPVNVGHGHAGVRRLMPLECERLQGFPDGWTEHDADGKPIPDSHRYRMLGNAVATVCAEWIGHRLMFVESC